MDSLFNVLVEHVLSRQKEHPEDHGKGVLILGLILTALPVIGTWMSGGAAAGWKINALLFFLEAFERSSVSLYFAL